MYVCVCVCVCVQDKWLHVSYMVLYRYILKVLQFGSTGPKCFLKILTLDDPHFPYYTVVCH